MKKIAAITLATFMVVLISVAVCPAQDEVPVPQVLVFSDEFEDPNLPGISASQGYADYGFGDYFMRIPIGPITMNLDGLPAHSVITLNFLLAVIDSWDGLTGRMAPDYVRVTADGQRIFDGAFDNTYPADQSADVYDFAKELVYGRPLAYTAAFKDSAYWVSVDFPHSGDTLSVTWKPVWKGIGFFDESFAIDKIEVWADVPADLAMASKSAPGGVKATWVLPPSLGGRGK